MGRSKLPSSSGSAYFRRSVDRRELRQRFLIVCEGTKTEPNYFRGFRVPSAVIEVEIRGEGMNTISLVEKATYLARQAKLDSAAYDQVWCVFDRDEFPEQHFRDALALAKRRGIKVAYSNEAFELWFVLHFHYVCTGMSRTQYCEKLDDLLPTKYQKNCKEMYSLLEEKQPIAIQNAEMLMQEYKPGADPVKNNPSTTVHLLVNELNRFIF